MTITRILNDGNPFPVKKDCYYDQKSLLSCRWITVPGRSGDTPVVMEFHLDFEIQQSCAFRFHVSADQQYILEVDGKYAGRGCEMKSPENWFFESYEVRLETGFHRISARVWNYGNLSPMNRMSICPGFFLMPEEKYIPLIGTGVAPWKGRKLSGHTFTKLEVINWNSVAPHETADYRAHCYQNDNSDWHDVVLLAQGRNGLLSAEDGVHLLKPSPIILLDTEAIWPGEAVYLSDFKDSNGWVPEKCDVGALGRFNAELNKSFTVIPANTTLRVIFDLENYYCAYSVLKIKDGKNARIRVTWAEAAFTDPEKIMKGDRGSVHNKYFRGAWDEFISDGKQRTASPLTWRCGNFIEVYIVTAENPLVLESIKLKETRYPLEMDGRYSCNDANLNAIVPLCLRTLQMSAHDNFIDCPFYEQLLYAGDGRLEALTSLVICKDDALIRKAISIIASSRDINGFTMARWPSNARQYIPSFSLWWIGILYDYALWRNDKAFVSSFIPGMRYLLDAFLSRFDGDGFLRGVAWEWNFIDWVDEWTSGYGAGTPPGINDSVNSTYNWLFVYGLRMAEELENYAGEITLAKRWGEIAAALSERLIRRFWNSDRGLFKEDDCGQSFSEHTQVLAVLSDKLNEQYLDRLRRSLFETTPLSKSSIFYKHYFFEACGKLDRPDIIISELGLWNTFTAKGFHTSPETPENKTFNQRSDCHGWGAHPLYHLIANISGIKPLEMGFGKVQISPMMGPLKKIEAECVHPDGLIKTEFQKKGGKLRCSVSLPPPISGTFSYNGKTVSLIPGMQCFELTL